ncbi:MAG: type II toxin-antitoxin system VapC family toxin, partial [Gaiellaceae bacterium]
ASRTWRAARRDVIADPDNAVFVSAATAWEIAIKRAKGTLSAPADVRPAIAESGFFELPIGLGHAAVAGALPVHHRDPFDRMLVAQAKVEALALVTADPVLARYEVEIVPADR